MFSVQFQTFWYMYVVGTKGSQRTQAIILLHLVLLEFDHVIGFVLLID